MTKTLRTVLAISMLAVGLGTTSAYADTMYSISPALISAAPGDVGDAFDVLLTDTGQTALSIAAFSFEVSVNDTDITLTGADYSTAASVGVPYIFAGDSFFQDFGSPLNFCNLDGCSNQILDASDVTDDVAGIAVAPGGTANLGEVFFNVAPGALPTLASLTFTGEVSDVANANNLSDPAGDGIAVDSFSGGSISIASAATVTPEPSSLLLGLSGIVPLAGWFASKASRTACDARS